MKEVSSDADHSQTFCGPLCAGPHAARGSIELLCFYCNMGVWHLVLNLCNMRPVRSVPGGWLTGALLAGGGFYRVPFWSACRGRMAGLQAGRSQLLVKELYHRLRLWDKVSRSFAWRLYEQPPLFICRERRCSHGYHSIDTPPYQQGGNHRQIAERPV